MIWQFIRITALMPNRGRHKTGADWRSNSNDPLPQSTAPYLVIREKAFKEQLTEKAVIIQKMEI
jgi:hypothetical protein